MAQLFDRLPNNFFSVLASPNKEIYIDCIMVIYHAVDSIEDAFQGDREYIVQKLIDYFDDRVEEVFDDIEEDESTHTSRQKAVHVINILKKTGWLGEEELGDYKTSLNLFDYSIQMIDTLIRIQSNTQNEYTGEIYAVYTLLSSFTVEEGVGILEQASLKTDEIIRKLKALKANIYRFYHDITKKRSKDDLHELLEKLLIEYKQNFFDSAYYNLKTTDSLSRYKRGILEFTSNLIHDEVTMDSLAKKTMDRKRYDDYNEAFIYVEDKLRYISDSFSALESLILSIDKKNEQYVTAAASKILFLTNQSDDIEGIFNRLFQIVLKEKDFDYATLFHIVQSSNLDTNSLYNQRRMRIDTQIEEVDFDDNFISDAYRQQKIKALLKNNIFGKKEIDAYVKALLVNEKSIEAKKILIQTQEDYVKLILIFLYSKSVGMHYEVLLTGEECKNNFVTFQNFLIKGKSYE
ncbi:MAG: Wadjet anti-phage system protein JetA family protein [Acholeplasmataceae bacterium]